MGNVQDEKAMALYKSIDRNRQARVANASTDQERERRRLVESRRQEGGQESTGHTPKKAGGGGKRKIEYSP